ncbi:hypothetical protein EON65_24955 [archaeon]|nr:MAG: hypothetical protein EON65_24955 [archaeon]
MDYRAHVAGQLVCHIPNNDIITTKVGLLTALRDHYNKVSGTTTNHTAIPNIPYFPTTYDLEAPADVTALLENAQAAQAEASESGAGIWIYKPPCNNRGRGIKVVSGVAMLKEICHGDASIETPPLKGIVQKYIERPLLLEETGYKFDLRCYLLIARNYPTTIAFYHPGYCRLALKPYVMSTNEDVLNDTMMHLTNASVQKKDPIYKDNKDKQVGYPLQLVRDGFELRPYACLPLDPVYSYDHQ